MFKAEEFNKNTYRITEAANIIGVTSQTLRNYEKSGLLTFERTEGGHRVLSREELIRYLKDKNMLLENIDDKKDVIYARVSTNEQRIKGELDTQVTSILEGFQGKIKNPIVLKDIGSGIDDTRRQLIKLINMVINDEVRAIFIYSKDKLTRFGYNYLETVFSFKDVNINILNDNEDVKESENDIISILERFGNKLYTIRA